MLAELVVSNLGVIERAEVVLGPGLTALTGETGAGKTLIVGAIDLLIGGRVDPVLVRPGADEARVDGRFVTADDDEMVLSRVVPVQGRSRAYIDGRPVSVAALAEAGQALVDLHGQHAQQSLLGQAAQRAALDAYARVDVTALRAARQRLGDLDGRLRALGGDARTRAREIDLLRYQVAELDTAAIEGPDEDGRLSAEEDLLADAVVHREAAAGALRSIADDGGARDLLGDALGLVRHRRPLADAEKRLRAVLADVDDLAADLRALADTLDDDPERLAQLRSRRAVLHTLQRKYGEDLPAVLEFHAEARARLVELESYEARVAELERRRAEVVRDEAAEATAVLGSRRAGSARLAAAIETGLHELAMPRARVDVVVEPGDAGDGSDVTFLLAANPGGPLLPLARVASGGELARTMLATRLALLEAGTRPVDGPTGPTDRGEPSAVAADGGRDPQTLVFDEVDAGVGGTAALAVGRALAALGERRQVLVVTHLPQVAACASAQVLVTKAEHDGSSTTGVAVLDAPARVAELGRMLSGRPGSELARRHAEELLREAAVPRPPAPSGHRRPATRGKGR